MKKELRLQKNQISLERAIGSITNCCRFLNCNSPATHSTNARGLPCPSLYGTVTAFTHSLTFNRSSVDLGFLEVAQLMEEIKQAEEGHAFHQLISDHLAVPCIHLGVELSPYRSLTAKIVK